MVSDHGEELGDHGRSDHARTMYQEVIRVPLLIRGPGVPAARFSAPVSLVDVAPTVLAHLGISVPEGMEGHDLGALWHGAEGALPEDRLIFQDAGWRIDPSHQIQAIRAQAPRSHAVRRGRFKLYYDSLEDPPYRLFDLSADPGETRDVSAQHPELAAELRRILEERHASGAHEPAPEVELAPEEKARLEALGYL